MRVKCAYCGKEFEQKPGAPPQKYCSERCARRARYEKGIGKEYVCQYCGKVFHPKTKDRTTYCSRECAYAHRKAKAAEREAMLRPIVVAREKLADLERRLSRFQPIKCIECGRIFLRGDRASNVRICSDECRVKHARRLSLVLDKKKRQRQYRRICEECGREFYTPYGDKRRRF